MIEAGASLFRCVPPGYLRVRLFRAAGVTPLRRPGNGASTVGSLEGIL